MGLTTLLTNSQERSYRTFLYKYNYMVHPKFRRSFDSNVKYIEKIENYNIDVKLILQESLFLKNIEWMDSPIQKKLCVFKYFIWKDFTEKMVYTKSVIDNLTQFMPFNSVYYRYVKRNTCYNWHTDEMKTCLHIPLITNPGCKFIYEDAVFSMPADGSVYIVNNGIPHTFANAGQEDRLHITMDILQ